MKKLIILTLMAFTTLAFGQADKSYKLTQVPTDKGGTWGAIPGVNGQLIFTDNAADVSKGDDFPSRLFVMEGNKETTLPNFAQYERIGSPYLSKDGNELYFTVSGTVSSQISKGGLFTSGVVLYPLQIMISKKTGGSWSEAEAFTHNSDKFSNGDPSLSPDGSYLYFTSDRDGGQGGTDIWRSRRNGDGTWGEPENVGGKINSGGDERFPRFDSKGNLYFSSTSGSTTGGLDLLRSEASGSNFGTPVRMNYPFNAEGDDFAISFVTDETGYMSSNRSGADRIYFFEPMKAVVVRDTIKIIDTKPSEIEPVQTAFAKLKYVYFDYDKSNLRDSEMSALFNLVMFLRNYPNTTIELPSYADCRGRDAYNVKLSKRRGEAVKKYLVEAGGIESSRVVVSEHGAANQVADCDCKKAKCNEAQYQANRRVEYKLLKY